MPTIHIHGLEQSYELDTLEMDDNVQEEMYSEIRQEAARELRIAVADFDRWSPMDKMDMWCLCMNIREIGRQFQLTIDDATYDDPLTAVVDRLVDGQNIGMHELRLQTAIDAVAAFYSEAAYDGAATRIVDRLTSRGVRTRHTTILRQIREASPRGDLSSTGPDLKLAAEHFLAWLAKHYDTTNNNPDADDDCDAGDDCGTVHDCNTDCDAGDDCGTVYDCNTDDDTTDYQDRRGLHYFNGTFYTFQQGRWVENSSKGFQAVASHFLQSRREFPRVTQRIISDLMANLEGQTVVTCGNEPLPFYIEEYGPPAQIEHWQLLAFGNGMLDLGAIAEGEAPELLPHDSRWFSTVRLPYDYCMSATCPQFRAFLNSILDPICVLESGPETGESRPCNDRRIQVLQEFFGYCLLSHSNLQRFLIVFGEGNNGKSVVLRLLNKMLGQENCSHIGLDQLKDTFSLQSMLGKMANICGDLNDVDAVAEGVLKQLTGEDSLTVQRKYASSGEIVGEFWLR